MEKIKLRENKIALERVKKKTLIATTENSYDVEKHIFKVIYVGKGVDESLVGKIIVARENPGVKIELEGKELIIISEADIIAEL